MNNFEKKHQDWVDQLMAEYKIDCMQDDCIPSEYMIHRKTSRVDFKSYDGQLWIIRNNDDLRQDGVVRMVKEAYLKSTRPNFEFLISVDDIPANTYIKKYFVFATTPRFQKNTPEKIEDTVPDYSFDSLYLYKKHKIENGDAKYTEVIEKIEKAGEAPPITDKLGWIGHLGTQQRAEVWEKIKRRPFSDFCDFIWTDHYAKSPPYMTMWEQVTKWRFIFEMSGLGWTDRLKHYFFSNRVIFHLERDNKKEFYFDKLIPWVHYVPVKSDLSDLKENYDRLINDIKLETSIRTNAKNFAKTNLTYDHAINRYINIIDNTDWSKHQIDKSILNIVPNTTLWPRLNFEILK
jgi:hypothetical protein